MSCDNQAMSVLLTDEAIVAAFKHADPMGAESARARVRLLPGYRRALNGFIRFYATEGREKLIDYLGGELWESLKRWQRAAVDPGRPGTYTQAPVLSECRDIAETLFAALFEDAQLAYLCAICGWSGDEPERAGPDTRMCPNCKLKVRPVPPG